MHGCLTWILFIKLLTTKLSRVDVSYQFMGNTLHWKTFFNFIQTALIVYAYVAFAVQVSPSFYFIVAFLTRIQINLSISYTYTLWKMQRVWNVVIPAISWFLHHHWVYLLMTPAHPCMPPAHAPTFLVLWIIYNIRGLS